jgi:DNA-directed RNA polymerase subunit RPC12/RpoP
MKRVHRTFFERFRYLAIYECRDCENEEFIPRRYTYHTGENARCPKCGSFRITKLRAPDKIDKMYRGPLNAIERIAGGTLHHCCFCRIQFFDRRKLAPRTTLQPVMAPDGEPLRPIDTGESPPPPAPPANVMEQPDTASLGE